MRKKGKIIRRLTKWISISVFSIALILFLLIYFSSKKIEGYWVNTSYAFDSSFIEMDNISLFENFREYKLLSGEYLNYYIFRNKVYLTGLNKNKRLKIKYNIEISKDKLFIFDEETGGKTTFIRIPEFYFNRQTQNINIKGKIFKVIYENAIDTINFINDSVLKSKYQDKLIPIQNLIWNRTQKNGLDFLYLSMYGDIPIFIFNNNDSIINLKMLDDKVNTQVDIQYY